MQAQPGNLKTIASWAKKTSVFIMLPLHEQKIGRFWLAVYI
jgi:hypothetical protein